METLFVFIVALLHKSIVTSASNVMRTLLFPLLSDLSRCYRILVCYIMKKPHVFEAPKVIRRNVKRLEIFQRSDVIYVKLFKTSLGIVVVALLLTNIVHGPS
jgi:predicted ferric reductase